MVRFRTLFQKYILDAYLNVTSPDRISVSYFTSNLYCKVFLIIDGKIFKNLWNNYRNYVRFLRTINESIFYMGIPVFWKSEINCTKSILFLHYINSINISFCNRRHFVSTPCKMKTAERVEFLCLQIPSLKRKLFIYRYSFLQYEMESYECNEVYCRSFWNTNRHRKQQKIAQICTLEHSKILISNEDFSTYNLLLRNTSISRWSLYLNL